MKDAAHARLAVVQNLHGHLEFLRQHPPFNQMEPAHLALLLEQAHLVFYPQGDAILSPQDGPAGHFYIVKQGQVQGLRPNQAQPSTFNISAGECFPLAALLGERPTRTEHLAATDCFCLKVPRAQFVQLLALSQAFREFALRGVSGLLDQVNQQLQLRAAQQLGSQYSLDSPLQALALRTPVSCAANWPLADAVRLMHQAQVGSIVIVDQQQQPQGIFTLRDLRRVIAESSEALRLPIGQQMSQQPVHLPPSASAFDAALCMAERHIAHLCVVDQGRLVGVISERDLFALQRVDLVHLARTIAQAPRLETLVALRHEIGQLVERMLAHGASSVQITRLITQLNDHCSRRVIELALAEQPHPLPAFTWLSFGSEARAEQTLHTDQDNGLLFDCACEQDPEEVRAQLLPLAQRINQMLAECGFSLCQGQVMAGNPKLCLSQHEWARRFSGQIRTASAEHLLDSSIYFDLRSLWGDSAPVEALRQKILSLVADNSAFQRLLAQQALRLRPPLGSLLRDFQLDEQHQLDLKVAGLTPFVDAARILALSHGIGACNTVQRLEQLAARQVLDSRDVAAFSEAYQFIQLTRLHLHQRQARAQQPLSNKLDPDQLNPLDRRILRESFRQAQRLQEQLRRRYQL